MDGASHRFQAVEEDSPISEKDEDAPSSDSEIAPAPEGDVVDPLEQGQHCLNSVRTQPSLTVPNTNYYVHQLWVPDLNKQLNYVKRSFLQ
eukprot:6470026-Amphidinium_carterae.1